MNRYLKLFELVRDMQPKHVVEVGTWDGHHAAGMMALSNCYYTGFDLFEDMTQELDEEEGNVKDHFEMIEVAQQIEMKGFDKFALIKGNTRAVLPAWIKSPDFHPFDFAFIDGGHSEETIKSDYEVLRKHITPGGMIVLDDHYTPPREGLGCNFLEKEAEIIDVPDPYIIAGERGECRILVVHC